MKQPSRFVLSSERKYKSESTANCQLPSQGGIIGTTYDKTLKEYNSCSITDKI